MRNILLSMVKINLEHCRQTKLNKNHNQNVHLCKIQQYTI